MQVKIKVSHCRCGDVPKIKHARTGAHEMRCSCGERSPGLVSELLAVTAWNDGQRYRPLGNVAAGLHEVSLELRLVPIT